MPALLEINVYLVAWRSGRILALRRQAGFWEFPGGGVEFGEDPKAAAAREFKEETGLTAMVGGLLGYTSAVYKKNGKKKHSIYLVFEGRVGAGGVVFGSEHVEARWVGLSQLKGMRLALNAKPVLGYLKSDLS